MTGVEYILYSLLFTSIMLSVIFFIAWKTIENQGYTLAWSLLFFISALKFIFIGVRESFPSQEFYWIFVNTLSLITMTLALTGFRQRAGLMAFPRYIPVTFILVEALLIWFTVITPHTGMNMMLIPYAGAVAMVACAFTLMSGTRDLRPAEWGALALFIIYGVSQFLAGTVALMQGRFHDAYYMEIYRQINWLAALPAYIGLGLFTVFILADDLAARMKNLAATDHLTNLLNRRGFEEAAARILAHTQRKNMPVCIVLADLDRFKVINDRHGHTVGDNIIKFFAEILASSLRSEDLVARVGGEEFIALLQDTNLDSCTEIIERLRRKVETSYIEFGNISLKITASFGITMINGKNHFLQDAINDADMALYTAKNEGRNCVRVCSLAN